MRSLRLGAWGGTARYIRPGGIPSTLVDTLWLQTLGVKFADPQKTPPPRATNPSCLRPKPLHLAASLGICLFEVPPETPPHPRALFASLPQNAKTSETSNTSKTLYPFQSLFPLESDYYPSGRLLL